MARPFSGKPHIGENRITRKNGVTYVYERTTQYNPETRKTMTTSTKLIGKIRLRNVFSVNSPNLCRQPFR